MSSEEDQSSEDSYSGDSKPANIDKLEQEMAGEEEKQEKEVVKQQNKPKFTAYYHSRHAQFTNIQNIQYSLTTRTIQRPRKFLVRQNDYICAGNKLYQVAENFKIPEICPGYQYATLLEEKIRVHEFQVMHEATSPLDRTRYAPKIISSYVYVKDLQCFADVYEPVGCSVEQQGIILSSQCLMELKCYQKRNRVVPQCCKVSIPNVETVVLESTQQNNISSLINNQASHEFTVNSAEKGLKHITSLQIDENIQYEKNDCQAVVDQFLKIFLGDSKFQQKVDQLVGFTNQFSMLKDKLLLQQIKDENYVLSQIINQLQKKAVKAIIKDFSSICTFIQDSKLPINTLIVQKLDQQILSHFFESQNFNFASIVSALYQLTQEQVKEVFDTINKFKVVSQLSFKFNESITKAMYFKNINYINYCVHQLNGNPRQFGQLATIAINNKLQQKDIKVTVTTAKIISCTLNPISLALFMCSNGFINQLNAQLAEDHENKLVFTEISEAHVNQIFIGATCNKNDSLQVFKLAEQLFNNKKDYNKTNLLIAAMVCGNLKILQYLLNKYQLEEQFFNQSKYLINAQHFTLLQQQFQNIFQPKLLEMFGNKLSNQHILKYLQDVLQNQQSKTTNVQLYSNQLMFNFICSGQIQCSNLLLKYGYSFFAANQNAIFSNSLKKICYIKSIDLFKQLIQIIFVHLIIHGSKDTSQQQQINQIVVQIICNLVQTNNLEFLSLFMKQIEQLLTQYQFQQVTQNIKESSQQIIDMFNSNYLKHNEARDFRILEQCIKAINIPLLNRYVSNLEVDLNNFENIDYKAIICLEEIDYILKNFSFKYHFQIDILSKFTNVVKEKLNSFDQSNVLDFVAKILNQLNNLSKNNNQNKKAFGKQTSMQFGKASMMQLPTKQVNEEIELEKIKVIKQLLTQAVETIILDKQFLSQKISNQQQQYMMNYVAKYFGIFTTNHQEKFLQCVDFNLLTVEIKTDQLQLDQNNTMKDNQSIQENIQIDNIFSLTQNKLNQIQEQINSKEHVSTENKHQTEQQVKTIQLEAVLFHQQTQQIKPEIKLFNQNCLDFIRFDSEYANLQLNNLELILKNVNNRCFLSIDSHSNMIFQKLFQQVDIQLLLTQKTNADEVAENNVDVIKKNVKTYCSLLKQLIDKNKNNNIVFSEACFILQKLIQQACLQIVVQVTDIIQIAINTKLECDRMLGLYNIQYKSNILHQIVQNGGYHLQQLNQLCDYLEKDQQQFNHLLQEKNGYGQTPAMVMFNINNNLSIICKKLINQQQNSEVDMYKNNILHYILYKYERYGGKGNNNNNHQFGQMFIQNQNINETSFSFVTKFVKDLNLNLKQLAETLNQFQASPMHFIVNNSELFQFFHKDINVNFKTISQKLNIFNCTNIETIQTLILETSCHTIIIHDQQELRDLAKSWQKSLHETQCQIQPLNSVLQCFGNHQNIDDLISVLKTIYNNLQSEQEKQIFVQCVICMKVSYDSYTKLIQQLNITVTSNEQLECLIQKFQYYNQQVGVCQENAIYQLIDKLKVSEYVKANQNKIQSIKLQEYQVSQSSKAQNPNLLLIFKLLIKYQIIDLLNQNEVVKLINYQVLQHEDIHTILNSKQQLQIVQSILDFSMKLKKEEQEVIINYLQQVIVTFQKETIQNKQQLSIYLLRLFIMALPDIEFGNKSKQEGLLKKYLSQKLGELISQDNQILDGIKQYLSQHSVILIVNDELVQEFQKQYNLQFFNQTIQKPDITVLYLSDQENQYLQQFNQDLLQQLTNKNSQKLELVCQNKQFSIDPQSFIVCYKNIPCSVYGLRTVSLKKTGVLSIHLKYNQSQKTFRVIKKFTNSYRHNHHIETHHNTLVYREKAFYEDTNVSKAFAQFQKFLFQKGKTNIEIIGSQVETLLGAQLNKGFIFYINQYKKTEYQRNSPTQFKQDYLIELLAPNNKQAKMLLPIKGDVLPIIKYHQFQQHFTKLNDLSLQQLRNLQFYIQLTSNNCQLLSSTCTKEQVIEILQQFQQEVICQIKLLHLLYISDIGKITLKKAFELLGIEHNNSKLIKFPMGLVEKKLFDILENIKNEMKLEEIVTLKNELIENNSIEGKQLIFQLTAFNYTPQQYTNYSRLSEYNYSILYIVSEDLCIHKQIGVQQWYGFDLLERYPVKVCFPEAVE